MELTIWEIYLKNKKDTDKLFEKVEQKCKELELHLIVDIITYLQTESYEKQFIFKYFQAVCEGEFWLLEEYQIDEIYDLMTEDKLACLYKMQMLDENEDDFYSEDFYKEIAMCIFNKDYSKEERRMITTLAYLERIGTFILSLKDKIEMNNDK